jgi:putative phage-type endonuclease
LILKTESRQFNQTKPSSRRSPIIIQRTPEWFETRKQLITASDFAQALGEGKFGTQKQLYQKKCGYEEDVFDNNLPPLKWGSMFEDVAASIYTQRNNTRLHDFGLIKHPNYDFFGASPDGITDAGIMLEIKCPYRRKITGEVPTQYYYQIQGQLDVCDLEECDYFECKFESSCVYLENGYEKGVVLERANQKYSYSPVKDWSEACLNDWVKENSDEHVVLVHYYTLVHCNTVRVCRDKEFINENLESLREIWNKILLYRNDRALYDEECSKKIRKTRSTKTDTLSAYSKSLNLGECLL